MDEMLSKSQFKQRGWTEGMIKVFLPMPDETKVNPKYASASPMKLYKTARIQQVEASADFVAKKQAADKRKAAAKKATATKQRQMDEYLENLDIEVLRMDKDKLIEEACGAYNEWHWSRSDEDCYADKNSNPLFLERITVNYLRHCLSRYEEHLAKIEGKVGARDAYSQIKDEVLWAIGFEYDWLADECQRQRARMQEEERWWLPD